MFKIQLCSSLFFVLILVAGCTYQRLTAEECRTADWFEDGKSLGDRSEGKVEDALSFRQENCGAATVDESAFTAGFQAGREAFVERVCDRQIAFKSTAWRRRYTSYYRHCDQPTKRAALIGSLLTSEVDAVRAARADGLCNRGREANACPPAEACRSNCVQQLQFASGLWVPYLSESCSAICWPPEYDPLDVRPDQ